MRLIADTLQCCNLKSSYLLNDEPAQAKAKKFSALWYSANIEANRSFFENFGKKLTMSFINALNFKVRSLYVNKSLLYSPKLRQDTGCFYNYFVQLLMKHDGCWLNNVTVKIDGSGDKEFKKALSICSNPESGDNFAQYYETCC